MIQYVIYLKIEGREFRVRNTPSKSFAQYIMKTLKNLGYYPIMKQEKR